jgi:arylsulfatase A-like enzyme
MDALKDRVGTLPDSVRTYDRSLRTIRTDDYKLIRGSDSSRECYRISDDPKETTNLGDDDPEWASSLEAELDDWLESFEHITSDGSVSMKDETRDRLEDLGYLQ